MEYKDGYEYSIKLLKGALPINGFSPEVKNIMVQYKEFFEYHQPNCTEKTKIVQANRETFIMVAKKILELHELQDKITINQMVRCISRNIYLFAYVVMYMTQTCHSSIEEIKNSFLESKKKVFEFPHIYDESF